ncbi:hypothetical protein GSN00_08375 [Cylindrospermopsis raciborskii CHAB3438]|uniref:hypothetical protein n=1 Tax=Cylindrospermopsis raciborskii TaxID=77022 RepID=UPI001F1034FC|nr:hypothetical protein [Cylindrospermopsis raciborskii]MCH4904396.1 hypothetical protein [Cylindrospermopsis raciborskii CHAB3438]
MNNKKKLCLWGEKISFFVVEGVKMWYYVGIPKSNRRSPSIDSTSQCEARSHDKQTKTGYRM